MQEHQPTHSPLRPLRKFAPALGLVGLLGLAFGGVAYRSMGGANPSLVRKPVPMICTAPACGKTFRAVLRPGERPTCPRCDAPAVPATNCPHCGKPIVLNAYRAVSEPTVCPHCRKTISEDVFDDQEK